MKGVIAAIALLLFGGVAMGQTFSVTGVCNPPNSTSGEYCYNLGPTEGMPVASVAFTSGGSAPPTVYLATTTPYWHQFTGVMTEAPSNDTYSFTFDAIDPLTGSEYKGTIAGNVTATMHCYRYCHVSYTFSGVVTFE